jgi:hypothetical protein
MKPATPPTVAAALVVAIFLLSGPSLADATSAEVAKKCRAMAIKAHPPERAGTRAYAQAERDFFRSCVARNGDVPAAAGDESAPPSRR